MIAPCRVVVENLPSADQLILPVSLAATPVAGAGVGTASGTAQVAGTGAAQLAACGAAHDGCGQQTCTGGSPAHAAGTQRVYAVLNLGAGSSG